GAPYADAITMSNVTHGSASFGNYSCGGTASGHGRLVLVVDEVPATLALQARLLKRAGFRVAMAKNAAGAQRIMSTVSVDAVVTHALDSVVPIEPSVPWVVTTTFDEDEDNDVERAEAL